MWNGASQIWVLASCDGSSESYRVDRDGQQWTRMHGLGVVSERAIGIRLKIPGSQEPTDSVSIRFTGSAAGVLLLHVVSEHEGPQIVCAGLATGTGALTLMPYQPDTVLYLESSYRDRMTLTVDVTTFEHPRSDLVELEPPVPLSREPHAYAASFPICDGLRGVSLPRLDDVGLPGGGSIPMTHFLVGARVEMDEKFAVSLMRAAEQSRGRDRNDVYTAAYALLILMAREHYRPDELFQNAIESWDHTQMLLGGGDCEDIAYSTVAAALALQFNFPGHPINEYVPMAALSLVRTSVAVGGETGAKGMAWHMFCILVKFKKGTRGTKIEHVVPVDGTSMTCPVVMENNTNYCNPDFVREYNKSVPRGIVRETVTGLAVPGAPELYGPVVLLLSDSPVRPLNWVINTTDEGERQLGSNGPLWSEDVIRRVTIVPEPPQGDEALIEQAITFRGTSIPALVGDVGLRRVDDADRAKLPIEFDQKGVVVGFKSDYSGINNIEHGPLERSRA